MSKKLTELSRTDEYDARRVEMEAVTPFSKFRRRTELLFKQLENAREEERGAIEQAVQGITASLQSLDKNKAWNLISTTIERVSSSELVKEAIVRRINEEDTRFHPLLAPLIASLSIKEKEKFLTQLMLVMGGYKVAKKSKRIDTDEMEIIPSPPDTPISPKAIFTKSGNIQNRLRKKE